MAYTPITNAEIDPDSPLTTGLFSKIRDNIEFGRNPTTGTFIDSGFTNDSISGNRLQTNSMNGNRIINNTVTGLQIATNAVAQDELVGPTASNLVRVKNLVGGTGISTNDNAYDNSDVFLQGGGSASCGFMLLLNGTVRLFFTTNFVSGGGATNNDLRLLKNYAVIGTWAVTQAMGDTSYSFDCSGVTGDVFVLQQRANAGGGTSTWKNVYVASGQNNLAVA